MRAGLAVTPPHGVASPTLVPMALTKFQKNALFEALVNGGVDPIECDLTETEGPSYNRQLSSARITHQSSGSFFEVDLSGNNNVDFFELDLSYDIGDNPDCVIRMEIGGKICLNSGHSVKWYSALGNIQEWATNLTQYIQRGHPLDNIPDLWGELRYKKEFSLNSRFEETGNAPFTAGEQAEIAAQLRQIKEYVKKTYSLTAEQMSRVEARFDHAEAASRRMGRKDWILLFGGALFTLIVSGVVTPDVVQHILTVAVHSLGHLFGERETAASPQVP